MKRKITSEIGSPNKVHEIPSDPVLSEHSTRFPVNESDIAIIGMAGFFPKANSIREFWYHLEQNHDCLSDIFSSGRDLGKQLAPYASWKGFPKRAGLIDHAETFDPQFFNIAPKEAELMCPQQRKSLELVANLLDDAGYPPDTFSGQRVGVFWAYHINGYNELLVAENAPLDPILVTGINTTSLANRISYTYNFMGPSETLNTGCSGSLVAVHQAIQSIRYGSSQVAIAGGVNLLLSARTFDCSFHARMLSSSDTCRPLDENADGFVRSEGCDGILLKPLSRAIADCDHIYAVIKGSAACHGGKAKGFTVPSEKGEIQVIQQALRDADIDSGTISYVELHGTGTSLGDPIEVKALKKAFQRQGGGQRPSESYCGIGSVKSNLGHLESASGIAGLIKVVLQMIHRKLLASIHIKKVNSFIRLENSPFYVVTQNRPWEPCQMRDTLIPRRAGVSSFGLGGTLAHVILEEYIPKKGRRFKTKSAILRRGTPAIIPISAKNQQRLLAYAQKLLDFLNLPVFSDDPETCKETEDEQKATNYRGPVDLIDLAYTFQVGRESMPHRGIFLVHDIEELRKRLEEFVVGKEKIPNFFQGNIKTEKKTTKLLTHFELDEELNDALKKWMQRGKFSKLAEFWSQGLTVNWNLLYGEKKPRRISLPTYPFAAERYWINQISDSRSASACVPSPANLQISDLVSPLHPFVHENTSNFEEQRFSSTFTGQEFFFSDHKVKGQNLLPGVAYLEMARAAVEQTSSTRSISSDTLSRSRQIAGSIAENQMGIQLRNIVWARPIIANALAQPVDIGLFPEENGQIQFKIYTEAINGEEPDNAPEQSEPRARRGDRRVVHCQGVANLFSFAERPPLDLPGLRAAMDQRQLSSKQCYEAFKRMGIDYGSSHQGLESVYVGDNQVLARLSLPSIVSESQEQFILHPSLIDSALQASIGLCFPLKIDVSSDHNPKPIALPSLPFALETLDITGRCTANMWAWIRYASNSGPGGNVQKLDIELCSDQGQIYARMKGFSTRMLDDEMKDSGIVGTFMCFPIWKEKAVARETKPPEYAQHLVILYNLDPLASTVGLTVSDLVRSDPKPPKLEFSSYANIRGFEKSGLVPLSPVNAWIRLDSAAKNLAKRYQDISIRAFEAIRGILKKKTKGNVLIQILIPAQVEEHVFFGLSGLLKTAHLENPKLIGQMIEVEPKENVEGVVKILEENSRYPRDKQIRYRDGQRWVQRLQEYNVSSDSRIFRHANIPFKQHGVYVITGGAGGLGLIFAKEIARITQDVTVILAGRSGLDCKKQDMLNELGSLGANGEYRQVNVSQQISVDALIQSIRRDFGRINGIFHSAGVVRDNFILKKNDQGISRGIGAQSGRNGVPGSSHSGLRS